MRSTALAAALVLSTLASQVFAQAPVSPATDALNVQRSRSLFDRGRKLTQQNLWEEACLLFEQAHELHPTGGTALQLANCYEHVSKNEQAIQTYQYVIEHSDTETVEDRVKIARERIEALKRRIAAAAHPATLEAPPPSGPGPLRVPAYVSLGAGGAGLVVGTLFGVMAVSQAGSVKSTCASGVCPTAERSSADSAKTKGWVSTVGFGVGIAGVSVAVALLLLDAKQGHPVFGGPGPVVAGADGVSFRF